MLMINAFAYTANERLLIHLFCRAIDFGTWFKPEQIPDQFNRQKQLNADGQSPPFVSEF